MAQWLGISLPMQGTQFQPFSGRIPRAAEQLSPWATTAEPALWGPRATTTEAGAPRAYAPQWGVAPVVATRESPCAAAKIQHNHTYIHTYINTYIHK